HLNAQENRHPAAADSLCVRPTAGQPATRRPYPTPRPVFRVRNEQSSLQCMQGERTRSRHRPALSACGQFPRKRNEGAKTMKNGILKWAPLTALLVSVTVAVAQEPTTSAAGVKVNPSELQKKAGTPPPSGTTKTTAIGTEHLNMTTPPDSQSWMEQLD